MPIINKGWAFVSSSTAGGGGTPGGSNTQVQFNDGGSFGGDADFTWNKTANTLRVTGSTLISGDLSASANISASSFYGDGSNLTGITASAVEVADGPEYSLQFRYDTPVSGDLSGSANLTWNTSSLDLVVTGNVRLQEDYEFYGDIEGAVRFPAQNDEGATISKGQVVYIKGASGQTPTVALAACDDAAKMPAFGLAGNDAAQGAAVQIVTFGSIKSLNLATLYGKTFAVGDLVFVETGSGGTSGSLTNVRPKGSGNLLQSMGKVVRNGGGGDGQIKVVGPGRTNATPNLDKGYLFVGDDTNCSVQDNTVFISSSANLVGINNTNPDHTLTVGGDISGSGNISASNFYTNNNLYADRAYLGTTGAGFIVSRTDDSTFMKMQTVGGNNSINFTLGTKRLLLLEENGADRIILGTDSTDNTILSGNLLVCNGTASISHLSGCSNINVLSPISSSFTVSASAFYLNGTPLSAGGGSPGGSTGQVQFNDGGSFGGDADFTWSKTANLLTITGSAHFSSSNADPDEIIIGNGSTRLIGMVEDGEDYLQLANTAGAIAFSSSAGFEYVGGGDLGFELIGVSGLSIFGDEDGTNLSASILKSGIISGSSLTLAGAVTSSLGVSSFATVQVADLTAGRVPTVGPSGKIVDQESLTFNDDGLGGGKFLQVRDKGPAGNNFTGIMAKTASISVLNAAESGLLAYLGHDGKVSASSDIEGAGALKIAGVSTLNGNVTTNGSTVTLNSDVNINSLNTLNTQKISSSAGVVWTLPATASQALLYFVGSGKDYLKFDTQGRNIVIGSNYATTNISGRLTTSGSIAFGDKFTSPGAMIGQATAPKITLDVHYTGSLDPVNLSNDTGGGDVVYFGTSSADLVAGGLYYLTTANGWRTADASLTGSGHNQLLAIALGTRAASSGMLIRGFFDVSSFYSGSFIKGGPVYIQSSSVASPSATGGGYFSSSAPTTSNSYVRTVGYATGTPNVIYFNPDGTYVELA